MVVLAQSPGFNPGGTLSQFYGHPTVLQFPRSATILSILKVMLYYTPTGNFHCGKILKTTQCQPEQDGGLGGVTNVWSPACQTLTLQGWPPGPEIPGVLEMGSGGRPQLLPNWISVHWAQHSQGPEG